MPQDLKLTDQLAADIRARAKSLDLGAIEKIAKAKDTNGTFDVIISTEVKDRAGEIVRQNGWDLSNYKNNPIVLWGHDYYSLPIGVCMETYNTTYRGVPALGARGVFYPAEINPLAQQVRRMYEYGVKSGRNVGCTTSVGFIPKEFDESDRSVITRAELLEFSFVPIPANQGVGPAMGRALTFDEAKELGLDVADMRVKGLEFTDKIEGEEAEQKAAQAGDDCSMEDGTPGVLATDPDDPDGAMVCMPIENKEEKAASGRASQRALLKALGEEHERHEGELDKAIDEFKKSYPVAEDQGDDPDEPEKKAAKRSGALREAMKDLRDAMRDEHDMHRARSIACFRSFNPAEEDKAFSNKEHLKALRGAHDDYEGRNSRALDEFEERLAKSVQGGPGDTDEHTDWITGKMEDSARVHKKAVVKIAKAMCKAAFGEEDQADEKTVAILKEFLTPHVDPLVLTALTAKIGARISAESKKKLGEAHEHMKAASAIVKALHGGLEDDDGEESGSGGEEKSTSAPAPRKQRSRPSEAPHKDELNDFLFAKELVREITTAAQKGLEKLNKRGKE